MPLPPFEGIPADPDIPDFGTLTFDQLQQLWRWVGGSASTAVTMASVAEAESAGRIDAQSISNDYGLWQINDANFNEYHLDDETALWPHASAFVALQMSSNGTNLGPWCTAWADPNRSCGSGHLSAPQPGSAVNVWQIGHNITAATAPTVGNVGPAVTGSGMQELEAGWRGLGDIFGTYNKEVHSTLDHWANVARGIVRKA